MSQGKLAKETGAPVRIISRWQAGYQYRIGSPLLLLFSTPFIVWQMGVLFFSGTTMSLFGRTPIPLTQQDTSLVIAGGYLFSISFICLFPRKAVWIERILMLVALAATALMLFPFPTAIITILFYMAAFLCVFSIGTMLSIAAHHFTVETAWRDGIISMVCGGILIAVLQNDFIKVDFTAFTIFSILLVAMQTMFYYLIPVKIEVPYAGRENKQKMPGILFLGIWLISGFATLLICFASSYAESVRHGVSVLYLSAVVIAVALYLLRKKLGAKSLRVFGVFFGISIFGFVLAYLSMQLPALGLIACVFLGFVVVLANLWMFFGAASFHVYPTRFIGAIGAGVGLALALLHAGLLNLLRNNTALLYGLYAALSVVLLLIYYFLEPYFTHQWGGAYGEQGKAAEPAKEKAFPPASGEGAGCGPFSALSEQERTLAKLILEGHTETSAARAMNITLNTQKGYRKNLYAKLNIHSKRELFELINNAHVWMNG